MLKQNMVIVGLAAFVAGLAVGAFVPAFTNPRGAVAAHQAGVDGGIVILVLAAVWDYIKLGPRLEKSTVALLAFGLIGIFVALTLAAAWGTSQATPIAGAGYSGTDTQETVVTVLITVASVATLVAAVIVFGGALLARRHRAA